MLETKGATVKVDGWGIDTIDQLLHFAPFHLVLLDLMLPDEASGYDLYHKIREHSELDDVPIALVTASDPDVEMNRARDLGFDGFISKPLDFGAFPKRIRKLLDGHEVWYEG